MLQLTQGDRAGRQNGFMLRKPQFDAIAAGVETHRQAEDRVAARCREFRNVRPLGQVAKLESTVGGDEGAIDRSARSGLPQIDNQVISRQRLVRRHHAAHRRNDLRDPGHRENGKEKNTFEHSSSIEVNWDVFDEGNCKLPNQIIGEPLPGFQSIFFIALMAHVLQVVNCRDCPESPCGVRTRACRVETRLDACPRSKEKPATTRVSTRHAWGRAPQRHTIIEPRP